MNASDAPKRSVTQEELDALFNASATAETGKESAVAENETNREGDPAKHAWDLQPTGAEHVGVHIEAKQSSIVAISKGLEPSFSETIAAGFENTEKFSVLLAETVAKHSLANRAVIVTLSGKPAFFTVLKLPLLSRSLLNRAFRTHLKAVAKVNFDEVVHVALAANKSDEKEISFLFGNVEKPILEKIAQCFKKAQLKILAWDSSLLCFARAASLLWKNMSHADSTRMAIFLGWDSCDIAILDKNGKMLNSSLPIGLNSFLEHLASTLGEPSADSKWINEEEFKVSSSDEPDVVQRKVLAGQAAHAFYLALAQQAKTRLFALCNENDVTLPTRFALLGPGRELFRIHDSLVLDLGLAAIDLGNLSQVEFGALGAAVWSRHEVHLNCLPQGTAEMLRDTLEMLQKFRGKWLPKNIKVKKIRLPEFRASTVLTPIRILAIMLVIVIVLAALPVFSRWSAVRKVKKARAELTRLEADKGRMKIFKERELRYQKRFFLKQQLEKQRVQLAPMLQELVAILPQQVKLVSLSFREKQLRLKGLTYSQRDLDAFLSQTNSLKTLVDATPVDIKREGGTVQFEITFKQNLG
ncbi:MAG: PilN domain-containing protein [Deltaproteobacteria bacterium]|nr:PilN domain-containing protein [Deltaproteobacteria bacterium]